MKIEQQLPNRPNFGKILLMAGIFLVLFFVIAWFWLHKNSSKLAPGRYDTHPVSGLYTPRRPGSVITYAA